MATVTRLAACSVLVLALAACGGADTSSTGDVDGEELFGSSVLEGNAGCVTCHSLQEDRVLVGPSLHGIGTRAANRVPGLSARDYLRQSIEDPTAYVVDGFAAGQMLSVWNDSLTSAQIDALVDYLMTLEP